MSANCLVTKLKGTVSNNKLQVLGKLKWITEADANPISGEYRCDITPRGGSGWVIDGPTPSMADSTTFRNQDAIAIYPDKYQVTDLNIGAQEFNVEQLCAMNLLATLKMDSYGFDRLYGNLGVLTTEALTEITLNDTGSYNASGIYGDITEILSKNTSLTKVVIMGQQNVVLNTSFAENMTGLTDINIQLCPKVTGNIAMFKKCRPVRLNVGNCPNITGTIEELVAGFMDNGWTTGSIASASFTNSGVTLNGVVPTGTKTLSWDSEGNITFA